MLLQEHNYDLYYDDEIEEKQSKSHQQRSSTVSVGFSDTSSCAKISPPSSFNNNNGQQLRRSTFDLSSFNSLSATSSDCCSPVQEEGAATLALLEQLAGKRETTSLSPITLEEAREEPSTNETQEAEDLFSPTTAATAADDAPAAVANSSTVSSHHNGDERRSVIQFILEGILLGHLIVPLLYLIVIVERCVRSLFRGLQRNAGFLFASLFAPSSSFQQEPTDAENNDEQQLLASSLNLMQQELVEDVDDDDDEDCPGSEEACCCYSSSSISSSSDNNDDNNIESEATGGWGHFADFQDELADEKSFIPFCSASSPLRTRTRTRSVVAAAAPPSPVGSACVVASTLETLDECREEDDDTEEDWSF